MKLLLLLFGVGLIYLSSFFVSQMNVINQEHDLMPYDEPEGVPPEIIVATRAMGGFRGLLIDYLWMRTSQLNEEGKYFELAQLFDLISKLESRIPSVWTYASWNMSYNISSEIPDKEQRWEWVTAGIDLLRHKGIKYCSKDFQLYDHLAWIFFHKVGGTSDDSNIFFKHKFARDMEVILGPDCDVREIHEFKLSLDEILSNPEAKKLYEACFADSVLRELYFQIEAGMVLPKPWYEKLKESSEKTALKNIELYYRKKMVVERAALSTHKMLKLEEKYGALEWKNANVHAIYWVNESMDKVNSDEVSINRMEMYTIRAIYHMGIIHSYTNSAGYREYEFSPDFDKYKIVHERYMHYLKKYEYNRMSSTFHNGYRNFLEILVSDLHIRDEKKEARRIFDEGFPYVKFIAYYKDYDHFIDEAIRKKFVDATVEDRANAVFGAVERYYKDKILLNKEVDESYYFNDMIYKNWEILQERRATSDYETPPVPNSLTKIRRIVLSKMIKKYQNSDRVNKFYIGRLQKTLDKLNQDAAKIKSPDDSK